LLFVTVTVYVPAVVTLIHRVDTPVFHWYEAYPGGAHRLPGCPWQRIAVPPVILQDGCSLSVMVLLHELVHPLLFVTVTVYVPAAITLRHLVLAPVFQEYEAYPAGAQM
jgi:hypothetical protein